MAFVFEPSRAASGQWSLLMIHYKRSVRNPPIAAADKAVPAPTGVGSVQRLWWHWELSGGWK
jgi:hypothetical protein